MARPLSVGLCGDQLAILKPEWEVADTFSPKISQQLHTLK